MKEITIHMKENKESSSNQELNRKIEERIIMMESTEYVFAKRFRCRDYMIVIGVIVICIALLIAGAYIS